MVVSGSNCTFAAIFALDRVLDPFYICASHRENFRRVSKRPVQDIVDGRLECGTARRYKIPIEFKIGVVRLFYSCARLDLLPEILLSSFVSSANLTVGHSESRML